MISREVILFIFLNSKKYRSFVIFCSSEVIIYSYFRKLQYFGKE